MAGTTGPRRPGVPPDRPSRARIFSYFGGGYDYTEADRAEADAIEAVNPGARRMVVNSRLFTVRATAWAVSAAMEIDQIIDMSCGFPLPENLHQAARSVRPSARVAYVDDDPEVVDRWDVLFGEDPPAGVAVACADFRNPDAVLGDPKLKAVIEPAAPVCLLFTLALNTMPPADARDLVAVYAQRIAPGSCIAISVPRFDTPATWESISQAYTSGPLFNFSRQQFRDLFTGLEVAPPGIAPSGNLRPGWAQVPGRAPGTAYAVAGIGVKP